METASTEAIKTTNTIAAMEQDDSFIVHTFMKVSENLVSDRTANQLQDMMNKLSGYQFSGIRELEDEHILGEEYIEFYPDANALKVLVADLLYQEKQWT